MHTRSLLVGAMALAFTAVESQASVWSEGTNPGCTGGALVTCASVQVRFGHFTQTADGILSVSLRGLQGMEQPSLLVRGRSRFQNTSGSVGAAFTTPQIIAAWRQVECKPGGLDCREVDNPATVTPEPVTMALLASGLVGMGGVSGIRRRMNKRAGASIA